MRIAVQGCCHGELKQIFSRVAKIHEQNPVDLLLILGDFQSIRNASDFQSVSIPRKYQKLGDFKAYYDDDELKPPVLTLFIGGNHESMRHLMLLPHGGYVSRDVFYLGYSNVVWYRGVRIGSLSGIWKKWDFERERPSWLSLEESGAWSNRVRELYHVRKSDVLPLFMLREDRRMDVMVSHDWPNGVAYHGNVRDLLRRKPFFEKDVQTRQLGSPVNWQLLRQLKPSWWLSAHLHVRYEATINHNKRKKKNEDELDLDLFSDEDNEESVTKFLSLDKCLPRRSWLEIIEVDPDTEHVSYQNRDTLYWDPEFISNLQEIATEIKDVKNVDLSSLKRESKADDNPKDYSHYAVPQYVAGIQRREEEQTKSFVEKFLLNI